MSLEASIWAWKQEISSTTKLVLLALADHSNREGQCWPCTKAISQKTGLTTRAIFKHISLLLDKNLIKKSNRYDKNGRQVANAYTLNMGEFLNNLDALDASPPVDKTDQNLSGRVNDVQGEDEQGSPPRVNDVHTSKENHPYESSIRTIIGHSEQNLDELFSKFWNAYPLKKAKAQAKKTFDKICPDQELVDKMIRAISEQQFDRQIRRKHNLFVPDWKHPATWLNAQCWEDELTTQEELKNEQHKPKLNGSEIMYKKIIERRMRLAQTYRKNGKIVHDA